MSKKRKKYDFKEPKFDVEIFVGIDTKKPITTLKALNNYYCKPIHLSRDGKKNKEGIKKFKNGMKKGAI